MADVILANALVITMDDGRRCYRNGYVWMQGRRIKAVGPMEELPQFPPDADVRDLRGRFAVMPGLVNAHGHPSNNLVRGAFDEGSREDFGTRMFPALRAMDGDASYAGALGSLLEQVCSGVTTTQAGEFGHPDRPAAVARACRESGMRVVFSRATMNSDVDGVDAQTVASDFRETPEHALRALRELDAEFGSDLITVAPEALSPMRCTAQMIQALHRYALERNLPFLTHVGAAPDESIESFRRHGCGNVSYLDRLGVLGPKTVLAHCCCITLEENALLAERGPGVVHCSVAIAWDGNRIPTVKEWLDLGVRVGLGTDGASTNNGQDLWETAKMAICLQKSRLEDRRFGSAELALELMTIGSARALHMENEIGSLEAGKWADAIVIDCDRPALLPRETLTSNLVYSNDRNAVRHVFVAGEELLRDGVPLRLDPARIVELTHRASRRVLTDAGIGSRHVERSRFRWM